MAVSWMLDHGGKGNRSHSTFEKIKTWKTVLMLG